MLYVVCSTWWCISALWQKPTQQPLCWMGHLCPICRCVAASLITICPCNIVHLLYHQCATDRHIPMYAFVTLKPSFGSCGVGFKLLWSCCYIYNMQTLLNLHSLTTSKPNPPCPHNPPPPSSAHTDPHAPDPTQNYRVSVLWCCRVASLTCKPRQWPWRHAGWPP